MARDKGIEVLLPPGRMVMGDVYEPQTTDADGKPLVVKTGANAGQPRVDYFFAVAIPKTQQHWANEVSPDPRIGDWGMKIWNHAHSQWPQGQAQRADFAWKIIDGDSQIPNKKGNRPCDRTGFPGHWVVCLSGGYAPKICNKDGSALIIEPGVVKCGHYVQALANVTSNESTQTAGIYINHRLVAHNGYGEEIATGPDPSSVGFGGTVAPGASPVPLGGMSVPATPPAPGAPSVPTASPPVPGAVASAPPVPGAVAAPVAAPPVPGATVAAPAVPVATPPPNTGFVAGPGTAPPPPGAAAAPAAPVRTMLPAAGGVTYEAFLAQGWNDAQLIAHGYMAA